MFTNVKINLSQEEDVGSNDMLEVVKKKKSEDPPAGPAAPAHGMFT